MKRYRSGLFWLLLGASTWLILDWGLGARLPRADLRFGNKSEPQTLDPAKMTGVPEGRIARALFEGLTYPNLKDLTRPKPGAAFRWDVSPDGKTYTFYLRENGRWSNGKPVTAYDFLFSWRRILSPATGSQYAELLWPIAYAKVYNQQRMYITQHATFLRKKPSHKSSTVRNIPQRTLWIRTDLQRKEVRSTRASLLSKPDSKAQVVTSVRHGEFVSVLDKQIKGGYTWYYVHTQNLNQARHLGWLHSAHLKRISAGIQPKDVRWFEVRSAHDATLRGWMDSRALTLPSYAYPNPRHSTVKGSKTSDTTCGRPLTQQNAPTSRPIQATSRPFKKLPQTGCIKGFRAWEMLGLRVRNVRHPIPRGYTSKALGKPLLFEVKLASPTAYFTQLASFYAVSPVYPPLVRKHPRKWVLPKYFIGNGPFKLTHWIINDRIRAEKNQWYWNAAQVGLKSIHFLSVTERDTQLSMYLSGDLDLISNNIPLPTIDTLRGRKDFYSQPYLGSYFYRLNVKKPPLNNVYVRRALAHSIDRKSITQFILRGGQRPARGLVPPGIQGYTPIRRGIPSFDPQKARKLLAQAGYPNGKGFPAMSLLYNTDQQHKQIAEVLQKMWHKHLGIRVSLVNREWKTYLDATKKQEYQIARAGWIGDYTDPNTFLSMFVTGGGHNRTGWSHSTYDRLINLAAHETDPRKRFALFRKAERILMNEAPILGIYYYNYQNLVHPRIQGHIDNPLNNFDFRLFRRVYK